MDRSGWEGGVPLPATEEVHFVTPSDSKFTVKGTFCEVAASESGLASIIKNDGMTMHSLSRGEIDWLHIVPTDHWASQQRLITRCARLCRVATRRHIWWSIECSIESTFWDADQIKKLLEIEDVHYIDATVSLFLTNIPCWKCVDDFAQLPGKFREFLNKIESDERPGECTITMDEVAGTGFEKSNRAVREEENEDSIGGLRNAARSITKAPGWIVIGAKFSMFIEEIVDRNYDVLAEVLDNFGEQAHSTCGAGIFVS